MASPKKLTGNFFDELQNAPEYDAIEKLTAKALEEQWNDLLLSGIVNEVFKRYKEFFVNRQGKVITVRKAARVSGEVRSTEDITQQEQDTLQADRFLVGHDVLKMTALLLFLNKLVGGKMKSLATYYSFKTTFQDYLRKVANKAGQSIIDLIPSPNPIKFRLSNKIYKSKIQERVSNLIKDLDSTTKKRMVNNLIQGIKSGETKAELVKRVQETGKKISESRAAIIVSTETQALSEYLRFETAKLNGVSYKVWRTSGDEKVCPICKPLDGVRAPIDSNFAFGGLYPPVHVSCYCQILYEINEVNAQNFVTPDGTEKDFVETIDELFEKGKKGNLFHNPIDIQYRDRVVNPNAVWAGGESLVGPDKVISEYHSQLLALSEAKTHIKHAIQTKDKVMNIDAKDYIAWHSAQQVLINARANLTDAGFVQLIRRFGFTSKIYPKKKI